MDTSFSSASLGSEEIEALTALYTTTCAEIERLRDYEWKIAYYFISLSAGLLAILLSDAIDTVLTVHNRTLLSVVQLTAAILAIFYMAKTHQYLTFQRNLRRSIEEVLGFYDKGRYREASLLPSAWKGKRITTKFQRLGLLVPLVVMVLIVQVFSIYLIWSL